MKKRKSRKSAVQAYVATLLERHFKGYTPAGLVTSSRIFPITTQVELQKALERYVQDSPDNRLIGLHQQCGHETLSFAKLWVKQNYPVLVGPLQYEEIDIGMRRPRNGGLFSATMRTRIY